MASKQLQQAFTLLHGDDGFPLPTDFNQRSHDEILEIMTKAVIEYGLDPKKRHVALGTYGDCVILEDGEVLLVSDAA